jgi:hypothetical protein
MNRMMAAGAVAVFALLGLIQVRAQEPQPTISLPIEEIARQVQSRNLDLFKAARSVEQARKDLIGKPELRDSSLSVGGGYDAGGFQSGWYGQSSLDARLLPQLSAGAAVTVEEPGVFGESLSLTVKPFEPARQTYSQEKALGSALVQERYLKRQIYLDAEQAALSLLTSDMERELARGTEILEQKKYELAQRRQDVGEASFQDVQDQLLVLIKARQDLFSKEQGYLGDWRTLQLLFAPSEERIDVSPLPIDELTELVQQRRAEVTRYDEADPVTEKLENLRLELTALQAQLEATPAWKPALSLSTAVALPYAYPDSHSVSMSMSFSPNQLKREDREELQEDVKVKRMEIAAETSAAALEKSLEQQNIILVEEALASAQVQAERDRVNLQEGELLFQQGGRTTLELEQLRLNLRRTQILNFQSAAEVYRVLGVYLMLFVAE